MSVHSKKASVNYLLAISSYLAVLVLMLVFFSLPITDVIYWEFSSEEFVFIMNIVGIVIISVLYYSLFFLKNRKIANTDANVNYITYIRRIGNGILATISSLGFCFLEFYFLKSISYEPSDYLLLQWITEVIAVSVPILLAGNMLIFIKFKPRP